MNDRPRLVEPIEYWLTIMVLHSLDKAMCVVTMSLTFLTPKFCSSVCGLASCFIQELVVGVCRTRSAPWYGESGLFDSLSDAWSIARHSQQKFKCFAGMDVAKIFTTNPDSTNIHLTQWGWLVSVFTHSQSDLHAGLIFRSVTAAFRWHLLAGVAENVQRTLV